MRPVVDFPRAMARRAGKRIMDRRRDLVWRRRNEQDFHGLINDNDYQDGNRTINRRLSARQCQSWLQSTAVLTVMDDTGRQ